MAWRRTTSGERIHTVTLQAPGPVVPDDDGSPIQTWRDLHPGTVKAKVDPATAQNLERLVAGAVIATATHVVTMSYHPEVTTRTRIMHDGRRLEVTAVRNPDEANVETIAVCEERVT